MSSGTVTEAPVLQTQLTRLTYADTDPAGILYYAAWFPRMEAVQSEFLFRLGLRQDTLKDTRGWWTVTRATECEYLAAAVLYDEIRMEMSIGRIGSTSFAFEHKMWRVSDEALVARGSVTLVAVSPEQETLPLPDDLRDLVTTWSTLGAPAS